MKAVDAFIPTKSRLDHSNEAPLRSRHIVGRNIRTSAR
jgi:hypothetical protein